MYTVYKHDIFNIYNISLEYYFSFERVEFKFEFSLTKLKGCEPNFKWTYMQGWQCPIHNGTLEIFISKMMWIEDIVVFLDEKLNLIISIFLKCATNFSREPTI